MPAIRSMLICGKPSAARELVGAVDLRRAVRAAVELEDVVVEVLDAEAQPRDADVADRLELGLGQRARLALEGDFLGAVPRRDRRSAASTRPLELLRREERRRAAAEVDEVERPAGDAGGARVELPLAGEQRRGTSRRPRRSCRCRRGSSRTGSASGRTGCAGRARAACPAPAARCERGQRVGGDRVRRPDRERRVVGDEVAADFRFGGGDVAHERGADPLPRLRYRTPKCFMIASRIRSGGSSPWARIESWKAFWSNFGPSAFSTAARSSSSRV